MVTNLLDWTCHLRNSSNYQYLVGSVSSDMDKAARKGKKERTGVASSLKVLRNIS